MQEWLAEALRRLRALPRRRVLEVGVGTGMLMANLVGDSIVQFYVAVDLSAGALRIARQIYAKMEGAPAPVEFHHHPAHELRSLASDPQDLVILNSTVQYFPSAAYLLEVLASAITITRDGGQVFVGDVRNLRLLKAFHLSVLLENAAEGASVAELRERVEAAAQQERELVLDPAFFETLGDYLARISSVEIQLKRTSASNELTNFRYDVILHVGKAAGLREKALPPSVFPSPNPGLAELRALMSQAKSGPVRIVGILNSRLTVLEAGLEHLAKAGQSLTLRSVRELMQTHASVGFDPCQIYQWAEEAGLRCEIRWSDAGNDRMDITLWPEGEPPVFGRAGAEFRVVNHALLATAPLAVRTDYMVEQELRAFLAEHLPPAMVPASFTRVREIPRTRHGKIDLAGLPRPAFLRPRLAQEFEAPRGPIEEVIASIWCELLGVLQVGRRDNFFALGGDSIISMQMVARARARGLVLKPSAAFKHQTVAELAAALDRDGDGKSGEARPPDEGGAVCLTPSQATFLRAAQIDAHHWNQAISLAFTRPIERGAMRLALTRLVARHEALRLRFKQTSGGWVAEVAAAGAVEVPIVEIDLSDLPFERRSRELPERLAPLHTGFSLETGPLLRAAVVNEGSDTLGSLVLIAHHLVVDAVSWQILAQDLEQAYEAVSRGGELRLPVAPSFCQATRYLAGLAGTARFIRQLDFWLAQASAQSCQLPRDFAGEGAGTTGLTAQLSFTLNTTVTRDLGQLAARPLHLRVPEIVVAGFLQALHGWTGASEFAVLLESHGRSWPDAEGDLTRSVGWFASCHPRVLIANAAADPVQQVLSLRQQLQKTPDDGIGFGLLAEHYADAHVRHRLQSLIWTEVAFNYFGNLSRPLVPHGLFRLDTRDLGRLEGHRTHRQHLLQVNAYIASDSLTVVFSFTTEAHRSETVQQLAARTEQFLLSVACVEEAHLQKLSGRSLELDLFGLGSSELDEAIQELQAGSS